MRQAATICRSQGSGVYDADTTEVLDNTKAMTAVQRTNFDFMITHVKSSAGWPRPLLRVNHKKDGSNCRSIPAWQFKKRNFGSVRQGKGALAFDRRQLEAGDWLWKLGVCKARIISLMGRFKGLCKNAVKAVNCLRRWVLGEITDMPILPMGELHTCTV